MAAILLHAPYELNEHPTPLTPHHSLVLDLAQPGPGKRLDLGCRSGWEAWGMVQGPGIWSRWGGRGHWHLLSVTEAAQTSDSSPAASVPTTRMP